VAESRWQAVAALVDPVRRALYDYVRRQDHPVTREEAADAQAISRNLTAFHLDKLVDADLLRARYESPADQPRGRGRTPKVYEPADDGLMLTVPPRQYALAGEILADAVAEDPTNAADSAQRHAFEHGRRIGQECLARTRSDPRGADDELTAAHAALADLGFEPRMDKATLTLGNCPFHALAIRQPDLICGLNVEFISGLLTGLSCDGLTVQLHPQRGACCVVIHPHPHPQRRPRRDHGDLGAFRGPPIRETW